MTDKDDMSVADIGNIAENGVFINQEEVVDGLRRSAEALGIDPDKVIRKNDEVVKTQWFARKNCKHCFGRGIIQIVPSPQKEKVFWVNKSAPGRRTKRKPWRSGPSVTRGKIFTGYSSAREDLTAKWDTRHEEPENYKLENIQGFPCRCVKTV